MKKLFIVFSEESTIIGCVDIDFNEDTVKQILCSFYWLNAVTSIVCISPYDEDENIAKYLVTARDEENEDVVYTIRLEQVIYNANPSAINGSGSKVKHYDPDHDNGV